MIIKKISCDNCGKTLSCETMYPHVFALELQSIDVNTRKEGGVYAVVVRPPINGTTHFCNKKCLIDWLNDI